ncbi:Uracil-DNA glycosylase [Patescibacteria group bacterium]|nr:Uracil-DNA glycosylase [Patescibacteria group bacterium]
MEVKIEESWRAALQEEFQKPYFQKLITFVKEEYKNGTVYPPGPYIFRAFNECPFDKLKVVILGQDPYHTPGVANGLAFSANPNQRIPPSLINIYKEMYNDLGNPMPTHPDLSDWAKQGVLLLNATLTVRKGEAGSHQGQGWEEFTDNTIQIVSEKKEHVVFILWGAYAQKKEFLIDQNKHLVIKSAHPSPFSADRGFFGSRPFSKTNEYLKSHGLGEINW